MGAEGVGGGAGAGAVAGFVASAGAALRGTRTSFARPISGCGEVSRILVLTANAAAPIARMISTGTTTATFDLMTPP